MGRTSARTGRPPPMSRASRGSMSGVGAPLEACPDTARVTPGSVARGEGRVKFGRGTNRRLRGRV
eukprot:scaffold1509_cov240-Pinguiococcus_pyrenoidosus.AAC.53